MLPLASHLLSPLSSHCHHHRHEPANSAAPPPLRACLHRIARGGSIARAIDPPATILARFHPAIISIPAAVGPHLFSFFGCPLSPPSRVAPALEVPAVAPSLTAAPSSCQATSHHEALLAHPATGLLATPLARRHQLDPP